MPDLGVAIEICDGLCIVFDATTTPHHTVCVEGLILKPSISDLSGKYVSLSKVTGTPWPAPVFSVREYTEGVKDKWDMGEGIIGLALMQRGATNMKALPRLQCPEKKGSACTP